MKAKIITLTALVVLVPLLDKATTAYSFGDAPKSNAHASLRASPAMFVENVSQFADGARFQVRGGDRSIWLAEDAIWVTLLERERAGTEEQRIMGAREQAPELQPRRGVNLKVSFVGASPHPRLEPFNRLKTHVSYFIGNDPSQWRPDVPVWGGVRYKDLYPGIDLEMTSENGQVEQRIVVSDASLAIRHSSFASVRLRVDGADKIELAGSEVVRLTTAMGEFTMPLLQVVGAAGADLPRPTIINNQVSAPFVPNTNPQSTISASSDPLYSTFLGGSRGEEDFGITVDSNGAAYVTGYTRSSNFPATPGAFQPTTGGNYADVFVAKLNTAGNGLVFATFLGGTSNADDMGMGIAVDTSGAVYVTGYAMSSDFPTTAGAFQTTFGGNMDAFGAKLNSTGSGLVYSTYLGGSGQDFGVGIAVDATGAVYVTGRASSSNFPTTAGAYQTTLRGIQDTFVAKVVPAGGGYCTLLGGSGSDEGRGIATYGGAAYVAGWTKSSDFPTTVGALQTTYGGGTYDAFVTKVNAAGNGLDYSTFLGGNDRDTGYGIAMDTVGAVYLTGHTRSLDFPTTPGAFQTTPGGGLQDAFVAKLNTALSGLAFSTFLGGNEWDDGTSIAVDASGAAYVTGETSSSNFPDSTVFCGHLR